MTAINKKEVAAIAKRYRARRFRRGFSLFGVLLGLGLAAVVIVGAVSTYNAAREAANRTEALVLLNRIRASVEAAFAGAPSYGNNTDLVAALDRRGGFPTARGQSSAQMSRSVIPSADWSPSPAGRAVSPTASASLSPMSTTRSARRSAMPMPGAAVRGPA